MKDIDRNINAQLYATSLFVTENKNFIMSGIGLSLDDYKKTRIHAYNYRVNNSYNRVIVDSYEVEAGIYLIRHRFNYIENATGYSHFDIRITKNPEFGNYGYLVASPQSNTSQFADNFIIIGTDKKITIDVIATPLTVPILIDSNIGYYKLERNS